jgi:uncharacterized membrane protein
MTKPTADTDATSAEGRQPPQAPSSPRTDAADRPRFGRVRRWWAKWDHAGLVGGLLFLVVSLMPSLLPRTWVVQGLVTGISFAFGYGVALIIMWVVRHLVHVQISSTVRRNARRVVQVLTVIVVPTMLWLGHSWQNDIRRAVHYPEQSRYLYLGVLIVAALTTMALVGLARLVRKLYRWVARKLRRWIPPRAAQITGAVLVVLLVWGFVVGIVGNGLRAILDEVFSVADHGTHANTVQPTSPLRSGSPASEVSWKSLGLEGRTFIAGGPTAAQISKLTGRPAMTPIRAYAGRESASSLHGEAMLVLDELKRTHAFDRQVLALATSTGTGWIDPCEADSLEYMFGGNTAIASMQYSYYPSWISFLIDRPRALEAGRELFDTVYPYWKGLPAAHRPRLVVFGESLGTFGASAAFSNSDDLLARTDGALFAGPPNSTTMWQSLTDSRRPGSLERLPVVGNGQTIRFAANASQLREPDGTLTHPHVVFLQHGSDPIVWWTPALLWSEPDWLTEPRAPDVIPQTHWYPIVSFWQITCDMIAAASPPPGYGHDYGAEIITAWDAILHPPQWTDHDTAALSEQGVTNAP